MKKNILLTVCLLFVLVVIWRMAQNKTLSGLANGLPDRDIVFIPIESDPVHINQEANTLGFINADGSGLALYRFEMKGGSLSNFGFPYYTSVAFRPRWAADGTAVFFLLPDSGPNLRVIRSDGEIVGQDCYIVAHATSTSDTAGNVYGVVDENAPIWNNYKDRMGRNAWLIIRFSLLECAVKGEFMLPSKSEWRFPNDIGESDGGTIVVNYYDSASRNEKILIVDSITGRQYSFDGYHPALNNDGNILAYYKADGALVIRDVFTNEEKILDNALQNEKVQDISSYFSTPGWSPDNQWLVYNTANGQIFKINIKTLEKIYLADGWHPDWR